MRFFVIKAHQIIRPHWIRNQINMHINLNVSFIHDTNKSRSNLSHKYKRKRKKNVKNKINVWTIIYLIMVINGFRNLKEKKEEQLRLRSYFMLEVKCVEFWCIIMYTDFRLLWSDYFFVGLASTLCMCFSPFLHS